MLQDKPCGILISNVRIMGGVGVGFLILIRDVSVNKWCLG